MNKKGVITVVVIIVILIMGYLVWGGKGSTIGYDLGGTSSATGTSSTVSKDTFAPVTAANVDASLIGRLKAVSVSAAETGSRVALVDGKAQFSTDGAKGSIALGNIAVAITAGGANYAVATLGVTANGKTAQYAVLFTDDNGTLADQSYDLISSGGAVTGLRADEISGGLAVTVSFNDASGKAHKKIMIVENGMFNPAKDISL